MKHKTTHTDQKYITALVQNDSRVLSEIYEKFAPKIIAYVKKNNGDETNAQDVIQDTLVTIYNQAIEKDLQLTCPFDAYFFLLCKRKWLNELKKKSKPTVTINEEVLSKDDESAQYVLDTELFEAKQELFTTMFEHLGNACKELLKTTFSIKSLEDVAAKLGQSYGYVRKKKSLCIGKLTELIKSTPQYQQLKNL